MRSKLTAHKNFCASRPPYLRNLHMYKILKNRTKARLSKIKHNHNLKKKKKIINFQLDKFESNKTPQCKTERKSIYLWFGPISVGILAFEIHRKKINFLTLISRLILFWFANKLTSLIVWNCLTSSFYLARPKAPPRYYFSALIQSTQIRWECLTQLWTSIVFPCLSRTL